MKRTPHPPSTGGDLVDHPHVGPGVRGRRAHSLARHLVAFGLALLLPTLLFGAVLLWRYAGVERARYERDAQALARGLTSSLDRELTGLQVTLQVLSTSSALANGDLAGFHSRASEVKRLLGYDITLRDPQRQQLVNTRVPWGEPLGRGAENDVDAEVVRTRRPAVSNLVTGAVTRKPIIFVVAPVIRGGAGQGEVSSLLYVYTEADRVRDLLLREGVPDGWAASVVDRNNVIVARSREHDANVGRPALVRYDDESRSASGLRTGPNRDGVPSLVAWSRSDISGWTTTVAVPLAIVEAPLRRSLYLLLGFGAALLAATALFARAVGRRIAGPIEALARQAEALGRGEPAPANPSARVAEAGRVGQALADASVALREREASLREGELFKGAILDSALDCIVTIDADSRVLEWNPAAERTFGRARADVLGRHMPDLIIPPEHRERHRKGLARHLQTGEGQVLGKRVEVEALRADGARFPVELAIQPTRIGGQTCFTATLRDITDRKRAEEVMRDLNAALESRVEQAMAAREEAEERLRQAQKMEAVGQLTGGVAHDFNNLLQIVTGSLEMLRRRVANGDARVERYLDSAADAARRGGALTQRLLAFSRRQALDPKPLDANQLVAGMSELLRRSLGETVRIETVLAGGLWRVCADPNQLENAILNLAVNARDAMECGGRLTIETANAHLDDRYARGRDGVPAGHYVVIAVSDTGAGMSAEVAAKAFEPFFTTKEIGKGTGLGLSQVYGFVRQSGGHVKIHSEPDQGTTVRIYLPRLIGPAAAEPDAVEQRARSPEGSRGETVLVVEDEAGVRAFTAEAVRELGYRVLEAEGAAAALRTLDRHPEIALLLTDVVMPDVNGRQLADEAKRRRPDLKVLFTTGYSHDAIIHNGVLDPGVQMIGKPFSLDELATKMRTVL